MDTGHRRLRSVRGYAGVWFSRLRWWWGGEVRKFKCALGFHQWLHDSVEPLHRKCMFCEKEQQWQ